MANELKHDWPMVRLGDVCHIEMGQAPKSEFTNERGEGLPLIAGAGDFTSTGLSAKKYTSRPTKLAEPGDLVLSIRATIGPFRTTSAQCVLGRGVAGLRAENGLEAKFLPHLLTFLRPALQKKGKGATFLQVSKRDISELEFRLPPLDEQRRIAAILDEVQRLNDLQESCLAAFDQLIDSLTQAITESKSESLGRLGVSFVSGKSLAGNARNAHMVNEVLKVSAVSSGTFLPEEVKPLPADYSPPPSHLVAQGDVLFCRANGSRELIGVTVKVDREVSNSYLPDKLWKLQVEGDQVLPMFVYRMLRSSRARQYFMSNASGAAGVKNISKRKVLDLRIPILSLDLQQDFVDVIQQVENRQARESVRLEKIAELGNSLISRVFRENVRS